MKTRRHVAGVIAAAMLVSSFVLAGSGLAADGSSTGGSTDSPAGEQNLGWASEWMVDNGGDYTRAQALDVARRHDLVAAMPTTFRKHADAMREVNPDLVLLAYVNGPFAVSWTDRGYPESWFAHDENGDRIQAVRFGNDLMNVHLPEWRNELVVLCREQLAKSGYDGCFLDTMGNGILGSGYLSSSPIDPRTGTEWDPMQWITDTGRAADHVRRQVGVTVATNGLGSGKRYFADGGEALVAGSDLAMAESFLRHPTAPIDDFPTPARWLEHVDMVRDVEARGSAVLGVTKLWTSSTPAQVRQWRDYTLGTLLLATEGRSRMFLLADGCRRPCDDSPSPLAEQPDARSPLGAPVGDLVADGPVYRRSFEAGLVAVNPTGAPASIALDGTHVDQHGVEHTGSVEVPAHDALLLVRRAEPTPGPAPAPEPAPTTTTAPPPAANPEPVEPQPAPETTPEPGDDHTGEPVTCNGVVATIVGTMGDDDIVGTDGPDVIAALHGNDVIRGLGGDDIVCGGDGRDVIWGGDGDDHLMGGRGDDVVRGEDGADTLEGRGGADKLVGNTGDDVLLGQAGTDHCNGGYGNDAAHTCESAAHIEGAA